MTGLDSAHSHFSKQESQEQNDKRKGVRIFIKHKGFFVLILVYATLIIIADEDLEWDDAISIYLPCKSIEIMR